jgi:hypothetical protein
MTSITGSSGANLSVSPRLCRGWRAAAVSAQTTRSGHDPARETPAKPGANGRARSRFRFVIAAALVCLAWVPACLAAPSQDEVFKSIQNNVDSHSDNGVFLAVLAVIAGVVLIVAVIHSRSHRPTGSSAALNNAGKLTRELMKATGLKAGQLRQLRTLADELGDRGTPIDNPLTLLLCPSLLRQAKGEDRSPKSETRDPKE